MFFFFVEMVLFSNDCCNFDGYGYDSHHWQDQGYVKKELCLTVCLREKTCIASEVIGPPDDNEKYKCYSAIMGDGQSAGRSECSTNIENKCYRKRNKSGT